MTITIVSITRPTACDHYHVTYTVNGGAERTRVIHRRDITDDPDSPEERFIDRLRSYVKENNLSTFAQVRNGIEGRTFQI